MLKYRDPEIQNFMLGANHGGAPNKQKVPKIKILKKPQLSKCFLKPIIINLKPWKTNIS